MKGRCPTCGVGYQIDDSKIPDEGAYARCPKCNARFFLTKKEKGQDGESDTQKQENLVTADQLTHAFEEICKTAKNKDLFTSLKAKFDSLREVFNSKAITYCLKNYINAELDYKTPGKRGLGRISTYTPRLAAYFRKEISDFSSRELDQLYCLIQDLILRGYLAHVLPYDTLSPATVFEPELLYKAWVPMIYAENPYKMPKIIRESLAFCADSALVEIKAFFRKHNMKGGGFFSRDKTNDILVYYHFAGFVLRCEETRQ